MFVRIATSAALVVVMSTTAVARDYVSIAGSSTVLPFATIVAERQGRNINQKTPVVESGGSSVGKKGVCDGIGTEFIDIGNASSRMKTKELDYCEKNGVTLTEIKVGYDGIVVANSKSGEQLKISLLNLGKALTAEVAIDGKMVANPYKKWSDIDSSLPDKEAIIAPTIITDEIALVTDIRGVCKEGVTLQTT